MKITDNFHVEELVHPLFIEQEGVHKMAFILKAYAPLMLLGLEQKKKFFQNATITVNNYLWDKDYKEGGWKAIKDKKHLRVSSGLRHREDPVGARMSGHYFLNSTDDIVGGHTSKEVQEKVLDNLNYNPYVLRLEHYSKTPTWNHTQWGYRMPGRGIEVFTP